MSNDKECLKHSRCKPKVFDVKLSCVEEKFKKKTAPKNKVKTHFDGKQYTVLKVVTKGLNFALKKSF